MNGSNSKRNGVCGRIPYVIKRGVLVTVVDVSRVAMTASLVLAPRNLAAHWEAMVHLHR